MKRLIVNADDFGMTAEISRGILAAASAGMVLQTTAMASSPALEESLRLLSSSGLDLDVGLHATLTWGAPLLPPSDIPTLVGPDGLFLSRAALMKRAILGGISVDEAYRELRAQCERLLSLRGKVSHLDGHHHVHVFPTISLAAERVAEKFGIRYVRSPVEGRWSPLKLSPLRRMAVALLPASSPGFWRRRGFCTSDHFGGFSLGAGENIKERWLSALGAMRGGTTEIMVHPGYPSETTDPYNREREDEVQVLTDTALRDAAADRGIKISRIREVAGRVEETKATLS